jgi:hypothetical protein
MTGAMMRIAIAALVVAAACGKGSGSSSEKIETKPIGKTGFVVDAPADWTVKQEMDVFYTAKGPGHGDEAQIAADWPMPSSLDEMVSSACGKEPQQDVKKENLPGGGFYVQCKGPSKGIQIKGQTIITTKIQSSVPMGSGKAIRCSWETDRDAATIAAVCRSLRKQP